GKAGLSGLNGRSGRARHSGEVSGFGAARARERGGHGRGIAGCDPHVDYGDLAVLDGLDRFGKYGLETVRLAYRPEADRTLRACHGGEVDRRIVDALADPLVLDRSSAQAGNALLVDLVVEERLVVGDHEEERNAVGRG